MPAITTSFAYFVAITMIKVKLIGYLNYLKNITCVIKCIIYCINMHKQNNRYTKLKNNKMGT